MKRKGITAFVLMIMLFLAGACAQKQDEQPGYAYKVYYINSDETAIFSSEYSTREEDQEALLKELLEQLGTVPEKLEYKAPVSGAVKLRSYTINKDQIVLDFEESYRSQSATTEVLTRAAIVKTLLQIKKYPYVMFTVESEPLVNSSKNAVGSMSEDSFVENPGEQINSSQKTTLTLYFSSKDGTKLVPETREVHYSSNISLEKLVMEQLMEGPKTKKKLATIPTGTKLITITVVDGVCYVNMDETFLNQNQEISEQVVLYSIVDSLTELSSIDKVQISINGDTSGKCRYTYDLAPMYKEDMSIVENGQEEVDSTQ